MSSAAKVIASVIIAQACAYCRAGTKPATRATRAVERKALRIVLQLAERKEVFSTGDVVEVLASLKNSSRQPISIVDWAEKGRFPSLGTFTMGIVGFPNEVTAVSCF